MTFAFSSRSRSVQRRCPSGAGPQASSIRRASARPSSLRFALSELTFRWMVTIASIPPSVYSRIVLVTVDMQTPFDFAVCSCVNTFPWDSSRSIMIWHLHLIVLDVYFLRIIDFNRLSSASDKTIEYFLGLAIRYHRRFFYYIAKRLIWPELFGRLSLIRYTIAI